LTRKQQESWMDNSSKITSLSENELSTSIEQGMELYLKSDNYSLREADADVSNTKSKEPLLSWLNRQNKSVPIHSCHLFQKLGLGHDSTEGGYS
jgi:hypothetical protein